MTGEKPCSKAVAAAQRSQSANQKSLLIQAVSYKLDSLKMPPAKAPDDEIEPVGMGQNGAGQPVPDPRSEG